MPGQKTMDKSKTGGPAFPVPLNPGVSWEGMGPCDGMTLRDYFAAKVMQGYVASRPIPRDDFDWYATHAYKMADAMLEVKARAA